VGTDASADTTGRERARGRAPAVAPRGVEERRDWACAGKRVGSPGSSSSGEKGERAAMRKLLHICYGVLKSGRAFDPSLHPGT
jgi:hypothetical protein